MTGKLEEIEERMGVLGGLCYLTQPALLGQESG